jgi:hypothetical protein
MSMIASFLRAAASAYRATGTPEAVDMAARIEAHAHTPFIADRGTTRTTSHLAAAVALPDAHPAVRALGPAIHDLTWTEGLIDCYCYATLIGRGTPIPDDSLWFGLYLQAPGTFYPSHLHVPEELYFVLSGTADWQHGEKRAAPFAPQPPGTLIHHRPNEPHAMRTGREPLLAMWTWFGDLEGDTYRFAD